MASSIMRNLAATTAVAMAFSPIANAAGLTDTVSLNTYRPHLTEAVKKAVLDVTVGDAEATKKAKFLASLTAGGFSVHLEEAAVNRAADKTTLVDYPKPVSANMLRIMSLVPAKGMEGHDIPVCAEKDNKVIGVWNITARGQVVPAVWTGQMQSDAPTSAACKGFVFAARCALNAKYNELNNIAQATTCPAPTYAASDAKPPQVAANTSVAPNPFPQTAPAAKPQMQ